MGDCQAIEEQDHEHKLIRSVLAGKHNDFEELVLKYQDMIFGMIRRQMSDEASARDLSQETFLKAFAGLKSFRFKSSFSTWLIRIALNVTSSYYSSKKYKERLAHMSLDDQKISESDLAITDGTDPQGNALQLLQSSIGTLKPKYREVIVLCSLEGKSYREAAEILQVPEGTICSRMNTALTKLRQNLSRERERGLL
jgi:RNA polymerase sigma-70 factor, ECF subfamily